MPKPSCEAVLAGSTWGFKVLLVGEMLACALDRTSPGKVIYIYVYIYVYVYVRPQGRQYLHTLIPGVVSLLSPFSCCDGLHLSSSQESKVPPMD